MVIYKVLIILIIVIAVILVFAILAQNSKGGVGTQFGGSGATQIMGVKRTGDFLERLTWILGASILVLTLLTSAIVKNGSTQTTVESNPNADRASETALPTGDNPGMTPIQDNGAGTATPPVQDQPVGDEDNAGQ